MTLERQEKSGRADQLRDGLATSCRRLKCEILAPHGEAPWSQSNTKPWGTGTLVPQEEACQEALA